MFRPDRIGTPFFHSEQTSTSSVTTALVSTTPFTALQPSVINATPLSVYDRFDLRWNSATAKSVAAFQRSGLVAQVTVPPPVNGNVVGIEVCAQLTILSNLLIVPIFTELTNTPAAVLANATTNGAITQLKDTCDYGVAQAASNVFQSVGFKENILIRDVTSDDPSGLYAFGFALYNGTAVASTFTDFYMQVAVRQLLDQPGVEYADTRR